MWKVEVNRRCTDDRDAWGPRMLVMIGPALHSKVQS